MTNFLTCVFLFLIPAFSNSQSLNVQTELFAQGFNSPTELAHAGDDRLFVVEQAGTIKIINAEGETNTENFLNITDIVSSGGERGLLGLAFHPDYPENGLFFINYTNLEGNTIIARYEVTDNPDIAGNVGTVIMEIDQPASNHNGGDIEFGPDGYLYIALGDGGGGGDPSNYAQNKKSLLGKMLRIDINSETYTVPDSNPFINDPEILDEIWALGLRNPWRFSFDRNTGDVWIADVGQGEWEEVNFQPAESAGGENYGWRCYEGNHPYNTDGCETEEKYNFPVFEYDHGSGCSITGGRIYRGEEFPLLEGHYFFADYCSGLFGSLKRNGETFDEYSHTALGFGISTFGENASGELFIANRSTGNIYKVTEGCSAFLPAITREGDLLNANVENVEYRWFRDDLPLEGEEEQSIEISGAGIYYVIVTSGNCEIRSEDFIVEVTGIKNEKEHQIQFYPNPVSGGSFILMWDASPINEAALLIYTNNGNLVYSSAINLKNGPQEINIMDDLSPGVYFIKINHPDKKYFGRLSIK